MLVSYLQVIEAWAQIFERRTLSLYSLSLLVWLWLRIQALITGKNIVIVSPLGIFITSFTMNLLIARICTRQQLMSHTPQPTNTKSGTNEYETGYKRMVVLLVEECGNEQKINKKLNHLSNRFSRWAGYDYQGEFHSFLNYITDCHVSSMRS